MREIYGLSPLNIELPNVATAAIEPDVDLSGVTAPMSGEGNWHMPTLRHNRLATGLTTFLVGMAAFGGPVGAFASGGSGPAKGDKAPVAATTSTADCDVTPDFGEQSANTQVGTSDSAFPNLYTTDASGNRNLLSVNTHGTGEAQMKIKDQLATDDRVLGYFTAFVTQPRDPQTLSLPNERTFDEAKSIIKGYQTNPDNRLNDLAAACAAVDHLTPVTDFATLSNQAEEIRFNHNDEPTLTNIDMKTLSSPQTLQGYEVGYNSEDTSLTLQEQAVLQQETSLFLITADGRMIIDKLVGPGSFRVAPNQSKAPVTPEKGTNPVPASASHETSQATGGGSQSQGQSNVGKSQHGHSGGGGSSSKGLARQNQAGSGLGSRPHGKPEGQPNKPHPTPAVGNVTPSSSAPAGQTVPVRPIPVATAPPPTATTPPKSPETPPPASTPPTPPPAPTPPVPAPTPPPPSTQKSGDTTASNNGGQDAGSNPANGNPII